MRNIHFSLTRADDYITRWISHHGVTLLRTSVGIVFFWFGVLKFFPALSPAEDLAGRTIAALTFGLIEPGVSVPALAAWECAIGLGLITGRFLRVTLLMMFGHMSGTITPLFLFPHETWAQFPYAATLEGQYIIKNLVLVSAGLVIYAYVRTAPIEAPAIGDSLVPAPRLSRGGLQHSQG
jgi:uncharacterized membrane protein YkgB